MIGRKGGRESRNGRRYTVSRVVVVASAAGESRLAWIGIPDPFVPRCYVVFSPTLNILDFECDECYLVVTF